MNSEDEEFNRIERESKQRMEAVYQEVQKRNKAMDKEYAYERGVMRGRELKREWVTLTPDEQAKIYIEWDEDKGWGPFYEAIEQALKEKNT
jgi:hypothetical protein